GIRILADIVEELKQRIRSPLAFLLAGVEPGYLAIEDRVKVVKTGLIKDDKELVKCYNACDAYLSLTKADNLPNSLIEAASCGLPIISFDSGGCREAVLDKESGYIASGNKEIIEALAKILNDLAIQESFSAKARAFAQNNFSMQKQVDAYVRLTEGLLKARGFN
ncbi:MAG: glycosyltransferase, partial [Candidatus Omnitrophica bacterium]|nr:glycosyltransferase [Candidatus Omnitrophota bacterium]